MLEKTNKEMLFSVVRHVATGGAAWMVNHGVITEDLTTVVISVAVGVATLAWSFYEKASK